MGTGEASEKDPADDTFKNLMDLKECIKDSPQFRQQLHTREQEISDLETKLEKVVSMCDKMVTTGNAYTESCRSFSVSLKDLAMHFAQGEVVAVTLKKFYEALSELQSFYSVLFDQTQKSVQSCLRNYLSSELRKVKESKKSFHRVSEDLANAIHRNGHVPKSKVAEAEEASAHLATMETQFSHSAVDYSYQINLITCNKSHEIMQSLLAYMRAQTTFFHEGYDWLRQFDPFMTMVETKVDVLVKRAQSIIQDMELRHTYVSPKRLEDSTQEDPYSAMENPTLPIEMSGYLFKKPRGSNPFKSWSRRWFILKTSKLVYQSESKEEDSVMVAEDLRICTVKLAEEQERRFCFEVVTPTRSCMLQADSEPLRKKWLCYLEAGIARALNVSASNKKSEDLDDFRKRSMVVSKGTPIHPLNQSPSSARKNDGNYTLGIDFLEVPGNSVCADCGSAKPTWASINLGVMVCIECSGIHRGMGVHISKVRSVTLDDWEPELQKIMCALGNTRVNAIYEYEIPKHIKKPTSESSRSARETFIRLKYVQHAFVHPHPDFTRSEAPVPPISIPELLAPSSSRGSIGSSPKSPQKRSFSPALKIRPRLLKQTVSRPSSASSTITDMSTPTGSEEDLRRIDSNPSSETPTGLYALAENFRKLEEKRKSSGSGGNQLKAPSWGVLGDKLKSARRSSKKISNYAMNKLGEGQESIMKRLKKTGRDRASREILRETLSDTEEEPPKGNSSLLYSLSASTHNLSSKSSIGRGSSKNKKGSVPPPKPPRTFKVTKLQDLNHDEDDGLDDGPLEFADDETFSSDLLSSLPSIESNSLSVDDQGLANGLLPSASSLSSLGSGPQFIPRSESSPQLSHNRLCRSESSNSNVLSESPRLQTISEDGSDANHPDGSGLSSRTSSMISPLPHASPVISPDTRLSNSVPLRRKIRSSSQTGPKTSEDDSSITLSSSTYCDSSDSYTQSQLDIPLPKLESTPEPRNNSSLDNRMSIISVTSAEYFSAESLDGGSKPSSASPSPDYQSGKGTLSISPIPPLVDEVEGIKSENIEQSNKNGDSADPTRNVRLNSSLSIDDESFNTPPSSPCPSATPSPNMGRASLAVYNAKEGQNFGGMATLKAGRIISEDGSVVKKASGEAGKDSQDNVDFTKQESTSTLKEFNSENASTKTSNNNAVRDTEEAGKSSLPAANGPVTPVKHNESVKPDEPVKLDEPVKQDRLVKQDSLVSGQKDECDGHVTISVVERSSSRGDETDSVFSASPITPTPIMGSPVPVPPKRIKRRRSSTMSNSACGTLPIRGSKNKLKQDEKLEAMSKDDNFDTEHKVHSESLVSAFSEKDYEDIFSSIISKNSSQVQERVKEGESGGGKMAGDLEPSPEVEVEIGGQEVRNGQAEEEEEDVAVEEVTEREEVVDLEGWTIIIPDSVHPNSFLYSSVSRSDIPGVLCALAHGGSANFVNEEEESRTPVLNAIQMGNKVMVEYLYQNGSKLTSTDKFGKGCLHYAASLDNASLVMMLLKRGANPAIKDSEGRDPISHALDQNQEDGDIITMLRMATLRQETKSGDNRQSEYQEQESEFFKDVEVASLVESGRTSNRMSTPSIEGSSSLDS